MYAPPQRFCQTLKLNSGDTAVIEIFQMGPTYQVLIITRRVCDVIRIQR